MTAQQRRDQLLSVGKSLFAARGYEAVTVEEIAAAAEVSKPVVYEHFGGKEGLYAVVVDREMQTLLRQITDAFTGDHPRLLLEQAGMALFDYIEGETDGFRILVRDSPVPTGSFASLIVEVAGHVEHLLAKPVQSPRLQPEARSDVLPDAGRDGGSDRPVVARRAQARQGRGRGPLGQPRRTTASATLSTSPTLRGASSWVEQTDAKRSLNPTTSRAGRQHRSPASPPRDTPTVRGMRRGALQAGTLSPWRELLQLLTPEGERLHDDDLDVEVSGEQLRGLFRDMVLVRRLDTEAHALQRQGELGLWPPLLGQEAAQIGAGRALQADDFAFPTYREHGVAWCRGVDPVSLLALFRGVTNGGYDPSRAQLRAADDRDRRPDPARGRLRHGGSTRRRLDSAAS